MGQLRGRTRRFLDVSLKKLGVTDYLIIPSNTCREVLPDTKMKKRVREHLLAPVLDQYPGVPIIAFGEAASLLLGGKVSETSALGKECELGGHICAFTYDYEYYLNNGRNKHMLAHIEATINASLTPIDPVEWSEEVPDSFGKELIIDVETTDVEYPWYGSHLIQLGIRDLSLSKNICLRPLQFTPAFKSTLQGVEKIIGHNILYDLVHLDYLGISFPNAKIHDTMIYHKNSHPNELFYGLKPLAKKYHGFPHWNAWFASKHMNKEEMRDDEWDKLCTYNVHDLLATEYLYLSQKRASPTFSLEMDYLKYVHKMIMNGMYVDARKLEEKHASISKQVESDTAKTKEIFGLGDDFNFNSPEQCLGWLRQYYPQLRSTNADVLSTVDRINGDLEHDPIEQLLHIRDISKLKGTGLEGLKKHLDADSLVHSSYAVHGAETGRSSSSNPNMQNTDPRVRPLFVPRHDDGRLVHTDLSGIEYRLIGHASADPVLLDVFNSGKDIHDEMYLALFGEYPPNKERRKKAKTANFCGVYGGGYKKFCLSAELPKDAESERLFQVVSGRYPGVAQWKHNTLQNLRRTLTIRNLFGRQRRFDYVDQDIEREAINWIIQSSGHDILKIYSMEMCDAIARAGLSNTLLVSEVHDSNTFDSPKEEYESAHRIIGNIGSSLNVLIESCFGVVMKVPIFAEVEVLEHWS